MNIKARPRTILTFKNIKVKIAPFGLEILLAFDFIIDPSAKKTPDCSPFH
jgi:hypothetical protein